MMKKVLSVLLAVCLLCGLVPVGLAAQAGAEEIKGLCGVGLYYVINPNTRTLTISGTGELGASSPWEDYDDIIDKVIIEEGVTAIGDSLFHDMSFKELVLPGTLKKIGNSAFAYCGNLETLILPEGLTEMGERAFIVCTALKTLVFPSTLTEIPYCAFDTCNQLTEVTIPSNIKRIGDFAFNACTALRSLTLKEGLESIGVNAFWSTAVETLTIPASVTFLGERAFCDIEELTTVVMLGGGTDLPREIFCWCTSLERIKLPDNLETVGEDAFTLCSALTRLDFPMSTREFTTPIANNCPALKTVVIPNPDVSLTEDDPDSFGVPGQTTLYTKAPRMIEYAINTGYDVQDPGNEPEDDWDPFATPAPTATPTPNPTPAVTPTPTPNPTPTPEPTPSASATWTPTPTPVTFTDVPQNQYYYNSTTWAVQNGIASGTGNGKFSPNAKCTRAQIVTFLWNFKDKPEPEKMATFSDMTSNKVFNNAISWAVAEGITGGVGNNKFGPNNSCTRGQAMVFLWNACGKPEPESIATFSDMPGSSVFQKAISWGVEQKITGGTGKNKFSPDAPCTRAQIVTFLYAIRDL